MGSSPYSRTWGGSLEDSTGWGGGCGQGGEGGGDPGHLVGGEHPAAGLGHDHLGAELMELLPEGLHLQVHLHQLQLLRHKAADVGA